MFLSAIGNGIRLGAQAAVAAATIFLVMHFWKRASSERLSATLWTRTFRAILIGSWWIAFAAWSVGTEVQAFRDDRGQYAMPILATMDHMMISLFLAALICALAAGFLSDLPQLGRTARSLGLSAVFLAPAAAAYFLSAYPLRHILPDASPGIVACLQVAIAGAAFLVVSRFVAVAMRVQAESTEAITVMPAFSRTMSRVVGLSFLVSFFALLYTGANVYSQPDHRTGAYTVPERFKNGSVRYMTTAQDATARIATWTLLGSTAVMLAFGYVAQRRAKKPAQTADSPTNSAS